MDHGGVPLHADGDGEVDGARQPYLGQRQQHRHQVGVPRLAPDAAKYKGTCEYSDYKVCYSM